MAIEKKKIDELAKLMSPLEESTRYVKGIIYGDPGVGKTVEAMSVADEISDHVLLLEADPAGWDSVFNHPDLIDRRKITKMKYTAVSQLTALADAIEEDTELLNKYDCLVIDTLSHIETLSLDTVLTVQQKKKKDAGEEFDFESGMWGIYRQNTQLLTAAFLKIYKAPIHVISTAHMKERDIKKSGITRTGPKFTPEILSSINTHVSLMVYMTASDTGSVDNDGIVEYVRKMQFHPTRSIMAKTRIGGLPSVITNPDLRKIIRDWLNEGGKLTTEEEANKLTPDLEAIVPDNQEDFDI